jgi:similar to stage IV sporulation protein
VPVFRALIAFLLGHLRLDVRGRSPERFLNLCLEAEIALWDIERTPDALRTEIAVPSFFRLRPLARRSRARVRVIGRRGLPFLVQKVKRRPALVAGALLCLLLLYWAGSHIWVVDVRATGQGLLDERVIRAVAASAGLKPGARKRDVPVHLVEQRLAERVPELSWASIAVRGVRARIQVVEKAGFKPFEGFRTDLVAKKPGMVVHLVTFSGEPAVRVGDYVQPGDTLIRGCLYYWGGGRPQVWPGTPVPPRDAIARCGPAEGQARARVWYERYEEVPLYRETRVPTGREARRLVLKWRDREIIAIGKRPAYQAFDEQAAVWRAPVWRNWHLPVELGSLIVKEVIVHRQPRSPDQVVQQARSDLLRNLQFHLGPADRIAEVRSEVVQTGPDFVGIRLIAETVEEIGLPVEVTGAASPPRLRQTR